MTSTPLSVPGPSDDWRSWLRLAETLETPTGVHAPSAFSAVLAACLPDLTGQVVLDAGCGAGLISIAALMRGAKEVIACDFDPAALVATRRNVERTSPDLGRLTLLHTDFRALGGIAADLALANPPQRPEAVLRATHPDERHLHRGGGSDGMDTIRLLLDHLTCRRLWTTGASALPVGSLTSQNWQPPRLVQRTAVPFSASWAEVGTSDHDTVSVWSFERV